ncbi:MAG: MarR family winged helix-turn-helix transcriptional regulator [Bacteroidia bacterium]|jgi:DNA-binding MarR family transcriptional regulator|nr:MarR family winged helix-turn-helix transcriptional regulator [Bacteroidia bacterium]
MNTLSHRYRLLEELLHELDLYQQSAPEAEDLAGFTGWLVNQNRLRHVTPQKPDGAGPEKAMWDDFLQLDNQLTALVGFMQRYAKLYSKKALAGTPLQSLDEFTYLAALTGSPGMSKTELIHRNAHEKTSGLEIIRRMVRLGLLEELSDTADRRSTLVRHTATGREVMFAVAGRMKEVSGLVTGKLTEEEKYQLVHLLGKLDGFHREVYLHHRDKSLEELNALRTTVV